MLSRPSSSTSTVTQDENYGIIPQKEVTMKFLVVGSYSVGKTSIVHRYVEDKFYTAYSSTIGIDFHRKVFAWTPNTVANVQLWDVAGNEKFRCVTPAYYRNANGAAIVFDVTRPETLTAAQDWLTQIREYTCNPDGTTLPVVLMANKWDLTNVVSNETILEFCTRNGISVWCSTSAKLNVNIEKAFAYLIEQTLEKTDSWYDITDSIKLTSEPSNKPSGCCA